MIGAQGIHYGQYIIHNDTTKIEYTAKQDSTCLHCLVSAPLKDSLISHQSDLIILKDSLLDSERLERYTLENEALKHKEELDMQRIKRIKKTWISGLVGFLIGLIVF